jgi:hypothetical protein
MAVPNVRPYSHPGDLKLVSPNYLAQLLSRYSEFLVSRGLSIPKPGIEVGNLDYTALANILMTSDSNIPCGLIDSLQCVREMSTPEVMDHLVREAKTRGVYIDDSGDCLRAL